MGLVFRRRKRLGRNSWLNLSSRGASVSERVGPVTVNSRGRVRMRLGKGPDLAHQVEPALPGSRLEVTRGR